MMLRGALIAAGIAVVAGGIWLATRTPDSPQLTMIDQYCVDCHNGVDFAGNLNLENKDPADVGHDAEDWEHVVRKLRTGMMPPAGEPRPSRTEIDAYAATLESRLDAAAADAARLPTVIRRLNRTEYANAIRDLLHLDVDSATLLPLDDSSEGFDNIANALGVSPSLVEAYVSAAMKLSRRALGDRTAPRSQVSYSVPDGLRQDVHLEGMPLGTRGGIRIEHEFPLDAEYAFSIGRGFGRGGGGVDVTLDGEPVDIGNSGRFRLPVTAGPHTLTVAVIDRSRADGIDGVFSAPASSAGVGGIEIDGPFDPVGVGDTPSRQRVLTCLPETAEDEIPCAREIVSTLTERAFRRPLEPADLEPLMAFYTAGSDAGFESGIQQALARILVDPRFLYRVEAQSDDVPAGTSYPVDDYELATRLSFFLWSSIPDDALLNAAERGELSDPAALEAQVRRMLDDDKANALVDNFASQWLHLRQLSSVTPDADGFDENLRSAMLRETGMLFETVLRDDLSVIRLLDADFTFVDERLAQHYGIDGVRGSHFRRVELAADDPRRGLLGHASVLTLTSVTNRTSPVIRGSWILETVLGAPTPNPPPGVETTLEGDDGALVADTVRARLEAHRENPVCASCHAIMDPVGLSLENYDLIGAWRDEDAGHPIDTTAVLTDGTPIDGPATLRAALLDRSGVFATTMTEKLMTYALGRGLEHYDMPTIRAIVREAAADDYRFSALVLGIVLSEPFRTRVNGEEGIG